MKDPRASSATPLVVGALLLLGAAALLIAFLPIVECPWWRCMGQPSAFYDKGLGPPDCFICYGKRRVPLLRKWVP